MNRWRLIEAKNLKKNCLTEFMLNEVNLNHKNSNSEFELKSMSSKFLKPFHTDSEKLHIPMLKFVSF